MLLLGHGVVRISGGASLRERGVAALLLLAASYGYELVLPVWNTMDATDAHYGASGRQPPSPSS